MHNNKVKPAATKVDMIKCYNPVCIITVGLQYANFTR